MFSGFSAWFSSSVSRRKKKLWVDHGGTEKSVDEAQFIFSQNATSPDTLRVFESEAYLDEHLSVFHPNYINQCVKKGDRSQVVLGKYHFPPSDVQEFARKQMQYEWDLDGNISSDDENVAQEVEQSTRKVNTKPDSHISPRKNYSNNIKKKHENSTAPSQPSTSKEENLLPRKSPRHSAKKLNGNSLKKDRNMDNDIEIIPQKKNQVLENNRSTVKNASRNVQQKMEIDRLEDMAFVSGELHDFTVGQNGCDLIKVS